MIKFSPQLLISFLHILGDLFQSPNIFFIVSDAVESAACECVGESDCSQFIELSCFCCLFLTQLHLSSLIYSAGAIFCHTKYSLNCTADYYKFFILMGYRRKGKLLEPHHKTPHISGHRLPLKCHKIFLFIELFCLLKICLNTRIAFLRFPAPQLPQTQHTDTLTCRAIIIQKSLLWCPSRFRRK